VADVTVSGTTGEAITTATRRDDNSDQEIRLGARGEQIVENLFNGTAGLAMEGSYFVAQTATPGTGIAITATAQTTFSDTAALLGINNLDTNPFVSGQGRCIYLDYVQILVTTVPTSETSDHIAHRLDLGMRNSAGTAITGRPVHGGYGTLPMGQVLLLPTVAAATANVRNLGRNILRTQIPVAFDQYIIKFGSQENAGGGVSVGSTAASVITVFAPQVVIPPGWSYVMNSWGVARAAAMSGEVTVAWYER